MLSYSMKKGQSNREREGQDWSCLDNMGEESLVVNSSSASSAICGKLSKKFGEMKDRIR